MPMRTDEALVAYLDGELDETARRDVDTWLAADAAARDRMMALAASASLIRSAFADIVNEAVPERLIVAARGKPADGATPPQAEIIVFDRPAKAARSPVRRWSMIYAAAAAGFFGLLIGGGGGYFGSDALHSPATTQNAVVAAQTDDWLNDAAGLYKIVVAAGNTTLADVPASGDTREALQKISQDLPQQVRLPNLKPWGLTFRGARLVVGEGRPAAQLIYTTDNKAIGPLTLIIGSSKESDAPPTFDRRQDVNLLYWRHQGHAYVLVGQTDIGYLWNLGNDIAWQLDAI
jgi:anti-sigma factor RsiW